MEFIDVLKACLSRIINVLSLSFLIALVAGCGATALPKYNAPKTEYPFARSVSDITVKAKPLTDTIESKKYFGCDLRRNNILAISIIVENNSKETNFIIPKERITYRRSDIEIEPSKNTKDPESATAGDEIAYAGAALISYPLIFAGYTMADNAHVRDYALNTNAYQTRTLSPGDMTQGFLYFPIQGEWSAYDKGRLDLTAIDPIGEKSIQIQLPVRLTTYK